MIIMAIDLGKVRTGLAVCDKNELITTPLCTLTAKSRNELAEKILEKIAQTKAEMLVIGLPKNMDGTLGESAKASLEFKKILEEKAGLPVAAWDERRTTIAAASYLNTTNTRGKKRKSIIDALSASIILENYIAYRKNSPQT